MRGLIIIFCFFGKWLSAQTLLLENERQVHGSLASSTISLNGHSELVLTGGGDPLAGCVVHLNDEDAWVFLEQVPPSEAASFLTRFRVRGTLASQAKNVRLVQWANGSVVIPHGPDFQPLEIFDGRHLAGKGRKLNQYSAYDDSTLGSFNDRIRSFRLKRGYMATFAANSDGSEASQCYVAQDSDLEVSILPGGLDNAISFVRIFPWRWVSKKGVCDSNPDTYDADWHYNWAINKNSTPDWEYVAIKQQPFWPSTNQNWEARGVNHISGFNEPDGQGQDAYQNLTPPGSVSNAVARTPELLATGLRVGAPAITDGGTNWIINYMNGAEAAGIRIDYVPVHYYRGYSNNNDPAGAASQMYGFLKSIHDATGKPIWVTEFNNGANWTSTPVPTPAQNRDVIQAMIDMMDGTSWVERYAVYGAVEWQRDVHYSDGSLTPMGSMYRDHKAPLGHQQLVPDSGLSPNASYAFEGNARDDWQGNNALVYGTPSFVTGKIGQAISFDGTDDFLRLPAAIGDSGDFTFAAWVKWDGGISGQRIVDLGNGAQRYGFLNAKSGDGNLRFVIRGSNSGEQRLNGPVLPTNAWVHVAVTLQGDTGKLFVNGAAVDSQAITVNPSGLASEFNYLGKSQGDSGYFDGLMDEVRFLTRAMTEAEVAALVAAPVLAVDTSDLEPSRVGIAFHADLAPRAPEAISLEKAGGPSWLTVAKDGRLFGVPRPPDRGESTLVVRTTGPGGTTTSGVFSLRTTGPDLAARFAFERNPVGEVGEAEAILDGGTTWTAGQTGAALGFDGISGQALLPAWLPDADELTVATWLRWDGGAAGQRVFDFGNPGGDSLSLTPGASGGNGIRFSISRNGVEQVLEYPAASPPGRWHHLAVTLGDGVGKLYLNGSPVATNAAMSFKPSELSFLTNYLGRGQSPGGFLDGSLDEFHVFHRSLSDAEIGQVYSGNLPEFVTSLESLPAIAAGQTLDTVLSVANPTAGLVYEKTSGPDWLAVAANGRISGIPSLADSGPNHFHIRASIGGVLADELSLLIPVNGPATLITQLAFDGNSTDWTGSFNGTRFGAPVFEDGLFDQALAFDGGDDYVQLPSGVADNVAAATFSARFRWDGGSSGQRVFDFGNSTSSYCYLTSRSADGKLRFAIANGGAAEVLEADAAPVGEWMHVAVVLARNSGTLYVNGVEVDSGKIFTSPRLIAPTLNYLGKSQGTEALFQGAIDDFRLYQGALPATTIRDLASQATQTLVPRNDFLTWMERKEFPVGMDGPADDPDGDGLATIFEFLFNSDPLSGNDRAKISGEVVGIDGEDFLQLTARMRRDRSGIRLTAEGAASLTGLELPTSSANAVYLGSEPDGEHDLLRWHFVSPVSEAPTAYLRLRAAIEAQE